MGETVDWGIEWNWGCHRSPLPCEILSIGHGNYRDGSEAAPIRSKATANAVNCDGLRNCRRQEVSASGTIRTL